MPTNSGSMRSLKIFFFCAYTHERERDRLLRQELEDRLRWFEREPSLNLTFASRMLAGTSIVEETHRHLNEADIILLPVTAALLTPACYESPAMHIMHQRFQAREVYIIPILLTPTAGLEGTWLGKLKALPEKVQPRPVSSWRDRELAFVNILDGVRAVILFLQDRYNQHQSYLSLIGEPDYIHSDTIQREEVVQDLCEQLLRADVTAIVLSGIGGSGKSTLAHLIYEHFAGLRLAGKSAFTGKVLWLTISVGTTLNDIAGTILHALSQEAPPRFYFSTQPRELALQLFTLLDRAREPHLIILDQFECLLNARGEAILPDVAEWLRLLAAQPCCCHFLLKSRAWPMHMSKTSPLALREYSVGGLKMMEGSAFLQSQRIVASPQALEAVVRRWQGHPQALASLAKVLKRQQKSLDDFLLDYQAIEGEGDVFSFLHYIYSHQLDERQRELLFAFAIFREPVSLSAAQTILSAEQMESTSTFQEALTGLLALRLLGKKQEEWYQPHSLIAEYVLSSLYNGYEATRHTVIQQAHMQASQYYQQQFMLTPASQERQRRLSDVQGLIEAIWHLCQAEDYHQAYTLMQQEHLFTDLQCWGENSKLLEIYCLLLPGEQWQPASSETAHIHAELGSVYHHLGLKKDACSELEQALTLFEQTDEAAGLVFTLNMLGEVSRALDAPGRALACYERALVVSKRMSGDEGMQLKGIILNNLGSAYYALKQLDNAINYYEQALLLHLFDRREEAITRNNLGQTYEAVKDEEKAYRCYRQALSGFQQMNDRRGEATVLMNLGSYWRKRGEIEQVFSYYHQSLALFHEIGDRWGEIGALRNIASLYRQQKNYQNALICLFQASDLSKPLYEPIHHEIENLIDLVRYELGDDVFEEMVALTLKPL